MPECEAEGILSSLGNCELFIGYGNPYFALTYNHSVDTMINTFGFTQYTAEAVVKRLLEG